MLLRRRRVRGGTAECVFCGREFTSERVSQHIESCKQSRAMAALRSVVQPVVAATAVLASAVRNVTVVCKTSSQISLTWALPLVLGSHPISDFEVRCARRTTKRFGKTVAYTHDERIISTSRWLLLLPVAAKGAIIDGLAAATDYDHIAVRAVSLVGAGAWSDPIEVVTTMGAGSARAAHAAPSVAPDCYNNGTAAAQRFAHRRSRSSCGVTRRRRRRSRSCGARRCEMVDHRLPDTSFNTLPRCRRSRWPCSVESLNISGPRIAAAAHGVGCGAGGDRRCRARGD